MKFCRTLAHFPPSLLAGLSAKGCQWCVLVDQADNDPSFRRQSKLDTTKSMRELQVRLPTIIGNSPVRWPLRIDADVASGWGRWSNQSRRPYS